MNRNIAIINSVFTLDASPPGLPLQLINLKGMLGQLEPTAFDLDIELYDFLCREKVDYDIIQYLLGGFAFSYPTTAMVPSNYYPFETMPMAELLISMMFLEDQTQAISDACDKIGIKYEDAQQPMAKFMEYINLCQEKLWGYNEIIISCNSIASVYFAILISHGIKKQGQGVQVYSVGKNMLIPEIKEFVDSLELIDIFFEDVSQLADYFKVEEELMDNLDFSAVDINKYNKKLGFHSINLSCSEGCPGKCDFCSIRLGWNEDGIRDKFRYYPIQSTLNKLTQIEKHLGKCFIHIDDCTFNSGSPFFNQLLEVLKDTQMLYSCNLRADLINEEIISKLKSANIYKAIVGLETINERTVKILNKGSDEYVGKSKESIEKLIDAGIAIQINILLYHPMESKEDVLDGAEKWQSFFEYLNHKNLYNYEAPIGTLCLNYPSKMYFDVLNSKDFKVVYHSLPENVESKVTEKTKKAFQRIPSYAIRIKDQEMDITNKMELVEAIYQLSRSKETTIDNYISITLNYSDVIMELWINNQTTISKNLKLDTHNTRNNIIELIKKNLSSQPILVKKLREQVDVDEKTFVVALAILSKEGYVELGTNHTK